MLAGFSPDPYPFVIYLFQFGWALPLWGLTQALLGYHFETMAQARAVARAQSLAYDAQLRMLHYQINPHFLFNTLNAISTLVLEKRNEAAESMLLQARRLPALFARSPADGARASQRRTRSAAQISRNRADALRRQAQSALRHRAWPRERASCRASSCSPFSKTRSSTRSRRASKAAAIDVSARRDGDTLRIAVEDDGPGLPPRRAQPRRRRGVGLANMRASVLN